ncbi:MAG: hypothetical protein AAGC93_10170 [Cyanobacteria bacterium P01_F01_bin.53]
MLGHFPKQQADADPATLIPWLKDTVLRPEDSLTTDIQVRLRGNILHVLCQSGEVGLPRDYVLMRLVRSLMDPEVKARFEEGFPQIYQIYVYSRLALERKPVWSAPVYLNRLERHLERLVQGSEGAEAAAKLVKANQASTAQFIQASEQTSTGAARGRPSEAAHEKTNQVVTDGLATQAEAAPYAVALSDSEVLPESRQSELAQEQKAISPEQLSDIMLARQGDSGAIASYLSETLSALNVGVKVSARVVPGKARRATSVVGAHQPMDFRSTSSLPAGRDSTPEDAAKSDGQSATSAARQQLVSRLWVFCEASYSPDPLVIAEPIAERLRQLHLRQFQDAVITIQVTGEASSDWRLRVDLTPPEDMLKEWGRWGDVLALSELVNQISRPYGLKLIAEVKKETLHLISYPIAPVGSTGAGGSLSTGQSTGQSRALASQSSDQSSGKPVVDIEGLVSDIKELLVGLFPQGLHRAMLYGPSTDDISPEWLRGIDLPALEHSHLSESTVALASEGDMPALAYYLTRALNPDLKEQLATGGIRVQLLRKDKLLHIMADGPVCPPKHGIVPLISKTLKQLEVPELEGVRLYGRRAGQKQPIWTHGTDYTHRPRLVPEAKPEFAASEAYIGELITPVSAESLIETEGDGETEGDDIKLGTWLVRAIQFAMIKSQIFAPAEEKERLALPSSHAASAGFEAEGGKMALVFGFVGLLLAFQFDFMVGRALSQAAAPVTQSVSKSAAATNPVKDGDATVDSPDVGRVKTKNPFNEELESLDWGTGDWGNGPVAEAWEEPDEGEGNFLGSDRFDSRDFTASAIDDDELIYSPQQEFVSTAALLSGSTLPTFRSQQLDEKIALYRRRVAQSGPPDVLVIGSSRALRGVDPAALRQALEQSGHGGLSVFNFGVNGATAQVVDLIVRRLIPAAQLPQMIVWADGARAFNSGRTDVTFNAIAVSEGYKQLEEAGDATDGINDLALGSLADQLSVQVKATDRQMSEVLGQVSSAYVYRGQIRSALSQGFGAITPEFSTAELSTQTGDTPTELPTETSLIDFDGFLALSTRFNPATYYQDHARVAGAYDGDYKDFQMEGKQADALNDLLYYTAQKDVPVIFINTPLTDEYLDSRRVKAEEEFLQYMLQKAERSKSMTFRDLGRLWPQRYDYFSDPSHLNRYGAYQVSNRLAQDPLIAWPESSLAEDL